MGCCKKDQCGVIGRVFVYIFGFIGIAFSLLTVFSCQFVSYFTLDGAVPNTLPSPFTLTDTANVGLFRWDNLDEEVENTGCVYYTNDEINSFDSAFRTAQIVGYVAVICAALALFLGTIEFVCCRFCCSKFFMSFLMIFAMITQALTFAIYTADNLCTNGRFCKMQNGAIFSIVAAGCYFVCSIVVCACPKPVPWIKRVSAEDDDTGCLACCCKKKKAPAAEVAENTVPVTDSPEDVGAEAAVTVAAGAAAAVGTAAVVAAAKEGDSDEEAGPGVGADDDSAEPAEGDEETGDASTDNDDASEEQSEVPSITYSEPSQAGEEITLELSQSMTQS